MGFLALAMAGGGFVLIGAWETLTSLWASSNHLPSAMPSSTPHSIDLPKSSTRSPNGKATASPSSSSIYLISVFVLSLMFILNSLISFFDALNSRDQVGSALQLQILAVALLFLMYSVLGLLAGFTYCLPLPSSFISLVGLFAFGEEFLLFYLQRKDPSGVENRYYDLMLLPIAICIFSILLELRLPSSPVPRLTRGIGLILHGQWFLQMGFSFFTSLLVHGCSLHEVSRGNYTVRCRGHPEYHRGRAIATLQFNIHLALLVVSVVGVYAFTEKKKGIHSDFMRYRPLGSEMQHLDGHARFTLDSDEDDAEIKAEENVANQKEAIVEMGVNGLGSH